MLDYYLINSDSNSLYLEYLIFLIKLQQNIIVKEFISIDPLLNNPFIISIKFGTFSII